MTVITKKGEINMLVDNFKVNDLKENQKYSALVPEMSAIEWQEFIENVKKFGIRQPITINKDLTILDGRHRVRACKELGIEKISAIVNEMTDKQAIEYVRDTAIERRSLTPEKRVDIILKCEDLMSSLVEEAKKRQLKGNKKGGQANGSSSGSSEPELDKTKRTNEVIADMARTSKSTVVRMKKIREEDPENYKKVVEGSKATTAAYKELPTVTGDSYQKKANSKKDLTREEAQMKVVTPMPDFGKTDEEMQREVDYENLKNHLNQTLAMKVFIEDLQGAAKTLLKKDKKLCSEAAAVMEEILNLIK